MIMTGGVGLEREESEGGGDGQGLGGGADRPECLGKGQQIQ